MLATLDMTRKDAKNMKEQIKNITNKFERSKEKTAGLLVKLTNKATVLEKLKARGGVATSLSAFLQMNELSDEDEEDDHLLEEGRD